MTATLLLAFELAPAINLGGPANAVPPTLATPQLPGYLAVSLLAVLGVMIAVAVLLLVRWRRVLRRQAALEKAKSELLMHASHELRSPLSVLAGYLALAREGALGEVPGDLAQALPLMTAKVAEMESLVTEMLLATELTQGTVHLHPERFDLWALVAECTSPSRLVMAGGRRLNRSAPVEPIVVEVDREYTSQVVASLLDFAVRASPAGGVVSCELREAGGYAELAVRDQGVGIPGDDQERLFSRFGSVASAGAGGAGIGLGLFVSRELARLAGGDITVRSATGAGNEFTLRLPLAPAHA